MNVGSAKAVAVKENDIGMANPGLHCGARAIIGSILYRGGFSNTDPTVEQPPGPRSTPTWSALMSGPATAYRDEAAKNIIS